MNYPNPQQAFALQETELEYLKVIQQTLNEWETKQDKEEFEYLRDL